jgi:hypothetical protein
LLKKKILLISIFLVSFLAVSAVSAADNATDDAVAAIDDNEVTTIENTHDAASCDESDAINADTSDEKPILKSSVSNAVEVSGECKDCEYTDLEKNTDEVLGAVNPDSPEAEPVLKAHKTKTVKMKVKYKWTSKKIGKYKIKARLWKVCYAYGYHNFLDIILYKNGVQQSCSSYLSKYKYKVNGKWKWWPKWRHGGANHAYHRYINDLPIKMFKVKFNY